MKLNTTYSFLLVFLIFWNVTVAQDDDIPTDDLGNVSDAFQENFFEALKQKGIENYELALIALDKATLAAKKDPVNIAVVNFEMGKNLAKLKRFEEAETKYMQVLETQEQRLEVLVALYDVYFEQRNYNAAIPLVEKLIKFDSDYKEDLANLYHRTQQYDKALRLMDELDENWGESPYRNALRRQIYQVTGNTEGAISNLEKKIEKNPKKEQDYLNLIFLYSEQGETGKSFETAKDLLQNQPKSKLVHLALYKFYLEAGEIDKALNSMDIVFSSSEIDKENKYKVLGDFIGFVNEKPEYEEQLEGVVEKFNNENLGQVYEQLGLYYVTKEKKEKALIFYEKGVAKDPDNYSLVKNTVLLQIDSEKYTEAAQLSSNALQIFPAQALLYLLNGVAETELSNLDKAIESLESGIDFLFDDPKMEKEFYQQLSLVYTKKGNLERAKYYSTKASEITLPINK